jgi:hypothetical protein
MTLTLMAYWVASLDSYQSMSHCCSAMQMRRPGRVAVECDSDRQMMA